MLYTPITDDAVTLSAEKPVRSLFSWNFPHTLRVYHYYFRDGKREPERSLISFVLTRTVDLSIDVNQPFETSQSNNHVRSRPQKR